MMLQMEAVPVKGSAIIGDVFAPPCWISDLICSHSVIHIGGQCLHDVSYHLSILVITTKFFEVHKLNNSKSHECGVWYLISENIVICALKMRRLCKQDNTQTFSHEMQSD